MFLISRDLTKHFTIDDKFQDEPFRSPRTKHIRLLNVETVSTQCPIIMNSITGLKDKSVIYI